MAPVTQARVTFAWTAVLVRESAATSMLWAEGTRVGLRFKLCIVPLFCQIVDFVLHFTLSWLAELCEMCVPDVGARASPPAGSEDRSTSRP